MSDLEHLLLDVKESLERELGGLRQDMQQGFSQLNARFDEARDREIADLRERLIKLERKSA